MLRIGERLQNLVAVFDNRLERIKDFEYTAKTEQQNAAFAYTNKSNKQNIVTVWFHTNRPTDYNATTPVDVEIKNVIFKNPIWVDLRNGSVYEIPKKTWSQSGKTFKMNGLPVYDSPVLIAEKELIELK